MASSRKRNGDGDDRSGNHKKTNPSDLDFVDDRFEVEESESRDDDEINRMAATRMMEIFVNTFTGKTISLLVYPTYTVVDVKLGIKDKEGIPVVEQALIYNNMVLDDSCTLFDFQIDTKSILTLMRKSRGFMRIFIKTLTRHDTITLEVEPSSTIHNIKAKIQDKIHIFNDEQALIFNEMVLHNNDTVTGCNIIRDSTLTLMRISRGTMLIFIKPESGDTISLQVKPSETVDSLKGKIEAKIHIPHGEQLLIFKETNFYVIGLDNFHTLANYNIKRESILTLMRIPKGFMHIFVKSQTGVTYALKVKPSDTIHDLKSMFHDKGGWTACQLSLLFNGRVLEDSRTLADYHIHNGSSVRFYVKLGAVLRLHQRWKGCQP